MYKKLKVELCDIHIFNVSVYRILKLEQVRCYMHALLTGGGGSARIRNDVFTTKFQLITGHVQLLKDS